MTYAKACRWDPGLWIHRAASWTSHLEGSRQHHVRFDKCSPDVPAAAVDTEGCLQRKFSALKGVVVEGSRLPDALRKIPKRIRDVRIPHILTEHSGSDMTPVKVYLTHRGLV